jgi:acid ceramidase
LVGFEINIFFSNKKGVLADGLPAPYGTEMKGLATAANIPLGDIVFYNIFYEIFTLCTSIVGQDTQGNVYHGRNLDFGLFLGWDLTNDVISTSLLFVVAHRFRCLF